MQFVSFFIIVSLSSTTSTILYPSFENLFEYLTSNDTLPVCTSQTCHSTTDQANYSSVNINDEQLIRLASYQREKSKKNSTCSASYLITSTGIFCGKRLKYRHGRTIDQFLGIYYAEIPRSFEKPVKKRFEYFLQNASQSSPYCMQSLLMTENLSYGSFVMQNRFNENCLSLNIYRPDLRYGEKRKAIMLFSHGGSNQIGGGSLFDGSILASEGDIIVITMNFRLNYHGFLSSGDDRLKGNYGLWDQMLAIEWIYENAHLFGGDPKRLVLAGHSAGAGNVMLLSASRHCRGMIKRVISQSGTGLAPWSINRQPMKLIQRLAREFNCQRRNDQEMFHCIHQLIEHSQGDFYRLHLSLSIADDNPYPVIDHDFLNDTLENLLQSDIYHHIDFLTGVTLNEGLYFAEYHIGHFYSKSNNQRASIGGRRTSPSPPASSKRKKRSLISSNISTIIAPDIIFDPIQDDNDSDEDEDDPIDETKVEQRTQVEQPLSYDPQVVLDQFSKLDYIKRYLNANFQHVKCYLKDVRKRYEEPGKSNLTIRLKLYIDLVSDLMFNFHMVHSLNLRSQRSNPNASNYAYIYSHRPTFKARSLFRDHLKTLPHVIGHFAELDYVFGVPLARGFRRIHTNVNMSYYNYTDDEENFSRTIIRYWSNFIKTGNPNRGSPVDIQWKEYLKDEHNYMFFQLNEIRNEWNYFDSMYEFWSECFRIESSGGCEPVVMKMKSYFVGFLLLLMTIFSFITIGWFCKHFRKKSQEHSHSSSPHLVST